MYVRPSVTNFSHRRSDLRAWDFGILGCWDLGMLGSWYLGILGPWDSPDPKNFPHPKKFPDPKKCVKGGQAAYVFGKSNIHGES